MAQGYHNSRVSLVTYDSHGKIITNLNDKNNLNDISQILSSLEVSDSNEADLYE